MSDRSVNININTHADLRALDQLVQKAVGLERTLANMNSAMMTASRAASQYGAPLGVLNRMMGQVAAQGTKVSTSMKTVGTSLHQLTQDQAAVMRGLKSMNDGFAFSRQAISALTKLQNESTRATKSWGNAFELSQRALTHLTQGETALRAVMKGTTVDQGRRTEALRAFNSALNEAREAEKGMVESEQRMGNAIKETRRALDYATEAWVEASKNADLFEKGTKESEHALEMLANTERNLIRVQNQLQNEEREHTALIQQNTDARRENKRVIDQSEAGLAQLSAEVQRITAAEKEQVRVARELAQTQREQLAMFNRMDAAADKSAQARIRQAEYVDQVIRKQTAEYNKNAEAQQKASREAIAAANRQAEVVDRTIARQTAEYNRVAQAQQRAAQTMRDQFGGAITSTMNRIQSMIGSLRQLSTQLTGSVNNALRTAGTLVQQFTQSASAGFAKLIGQVQSVGKAFMGLGGIIRSSLGGSQRSMQEFYAAGWSMLMTGQMVTQGGQRVLGSMGRGMSGFMEYEKNLTRTSISGQADPALIEDMIFDVQRGANGNTPIYQFDAATLAQGLYFYTSAIGKTITEQNRDAIVESVTPILSMAAYTQTAPETAIKSVMNTALEFGIDPRNMANSDRIGQIAAQMGYLANISTMEVPDIAETFKMVGPMAHLLSGSAPGAGLEEMMTFTFLASEMGLRGGNVGRGLGQAFTTLLDPTDKVQGLSQEVFGGSVEDVFLDAAGHLEGGIEGFLQKFADPSLGPQANALLAEFFTTNATRATIAAVAQLRKDPAKFARITAELSGDAPMRLLNEALVKTNDTIGQNLQNFKSAWFAVQTMVIRSVEGPIKGALSMFANLFWDIADALKANPMIGKFLAIIGGMAGVLLTVVGALMSFGGAILVTARAFSMMGAVAHPIFALLVALPSLFMTIVPILLLLAALGIGLYMAWQNNLGGIRDLVEEFTTDFEGAFKDRVWPIIKSTGVFLLQLAKAFQEFVTGVLGGSGPTNNLGAFMIRLFGDDAGRQVYAMLLGLGDALEGTRDRFVAFYNDIVRGARAIKAFTDDVLSVFINALLGIESNVNQISYANAFGKLVFGVDDFAAKLVTAAEYTRTAVGNIISYLMLLKAIVTTSFSNIRINIDMIFSENNIQAALSGLEALVTGIAIGFATAIALAGAALVAFTGKLANAGKAGEWINGYTQKWLGLQLTITGVAQAIGTAIGLYLGVRLVMALTPGLGIITRLGGALLGLLPSVFNFGMMIGNAAIQVALFVGRLAVMAAALIVQGALLAGQAAIWAIITLAKIADTAATIAQAAGMSLLTLATSAGGVAAIIASGGFLGLSMSLIVAAAAAVGLDIAMWPLVAVLGLVVGLILAVVAVMAVFAGAFLAALIFIEPFRQGLWDLTMAILPGFVMVLGAVAIAVGFVVKILGAMFATIGRQMSQLAEHTTLMKAFGVAMGLVFVVMISPILLVGLLIAALLATFLLSVMGILAVLNLLADAIAWLANPIENIQNLFGTLADFVEKVFTESAVAIKRLMIPVLEAMQEALNGYNALASRLWKMPEIDSPFTGMLESMRADVDEYDKAKKILEAPLFPNYDTSSFEVQGESAGNSFYNGLMGALDKIGLDDELKGIFAKMGLDPENPDFANFDWKTMFNMPEYEQLQADFDSGSMDFLPRSMRRQMEEMQAWEAYLDIVDRFDGNRMKANAFYEANEQPIPVDPFAPVVDAVQEDAEQAAADIQEAIDGFEKEMFASLRSMDLGNALDGAFGGGAGPGQKSLAGGLFDIYDEIAQNIPDGAAPWANVYEAVMDLQAKGAYVAGDNVRTMLANDPGFQYFASQVGVAVEDLLKDVPKFISNDALLPLAFTEMAAGLQDLPPDVYKSLDTLGKGIINEFGLEWQEIGQYAIANAGTTWNLADYLVDAYDISIDEANALIAAHPGLDPGVISNEMFEGVELALESELGDVAVISAEWWDYLMSVTQDGADKTIEISKAAFDALPTYVKIGMDNMGYAFVIGGNETAAQAMNSAKVVMDAFRETWGGGEGGFRATTGEVIDGWIEVRQEIDGVLGEPFMVPALDYANYKNSVEEYNRITDELIAAADRWKAYSSLADNVGVPAANRFWEANEEFGAGDIPTDPSQGTAGIAPPGLPPVTDYATAGTDSATAFMGTFSSTVSTGMTTLATGGAGGSSISVSSFQTMGTSAGEKFILGFQQTLTNQLGTAMAGIGSGVGGDGTGGPTGASGPFDAMFTSYAMSAANAFKVELDLKMAEAVTGLGDLAAGGSGGGGNVKGSNPYDEIFKGYATTAAQAFSEQLGTSMGETFASNNWADARVSGEGAVGPFDSMFQNYARAAALAFQNELGIQMGKQLQPSNWVDLRMAGEGAVGPFDSMFQGYANAASDAFGTTLGSNMALKIAEINTTLTTTPFKATFDADTGPMAIAFTEVMTWGGIFDEENFIATFSGDTGPAAIAYTDVMGWGDIWEQSNFIATFSVDSAVAMQAIEDLIARANAFATTYTALLRVITEGAGMIDNIRFQLNQLDGKVATTYVRTVNQTTTEKTKGYATGGVTQSGLNFVGERGVELMAAPSGTRVQSSARTMNMLQGAVGYAMRDFVSPIIGTIEAAMASEGRASNRSANAMFSADGKPLTPKTITIINSGSGNNSTNSGNSLTIGTVVIKETADARAIFNEFDRWSGEKHELNLRGQGDPVDDGFRRN